MKASPGPSRLLKAAAAYNAVWGALAILAPRQVGRALGFSDAGDGMGWRAAGVVVLAYAPAYLWAARDPMVERPIVATAVLGKSMGALGWIAGFLTGRFPRRTFLLPLLNDVLWLPGMVRLLAAR